MFNLIKKDHKEKKPRIQYSIKTKSKVFDDRPRLPYFLPWCYVEPYTGIVHGKDNSFMAVYEFQGRDMASSTPEELMQYNAGLNNVFKSLPTGYVLYFDAQRHIATDYQKSEIDNPLVQKFEDERAKYYEEKEHYETNYYFIVYYEPPKKTKSLLTRAFIDDERNNHKNYDIDMKIVRDETDSFINKVNLIGTMLDSWFTNIHALDAEETVTYLHSTVSLNHNKVNFNDTKFITDYICDSEIETGKDIIWTNELDEKIYAKMVTIIDFSPISHPGTFDFLTDLNFEYRWTSRFICMSKEDAKKELAGFWARWNQQITTFWSKTIAAISHQPPTTGDQDPAAIYNRDDVTEAQQELGLDAVSYGYYTTTMLVTDHDYDTCIRKAKNIVKEVNGKGYLAFIEGYNSMEAWWGSIPGCPRANVRKPIINSLNFCHLAPVTAMWPGDKKNDYLQGPVLLYTDTNGYTPYRLSLHVNDVGHTLICGPTGSGKSVLLNTLEAHSLKYRNSNVFIFDKAASSRALTTAIGGNFYNIAAEGSNELSFQPLAHIDDEQEIKWANEWILAYLNSKNLKITPAEEDLVWKALLLVKGFPENKRTLSNFSIMLQDQKLRQAIRPLTKAGSYGKMFDNSKDISGHGNWQVFEMETLMATPAIVPVTLDYLFHRIENNLKKAKGPSIIVFDECWLFLDNEIFRAKLKEYFKDMRKKNTSIIVATQNLSDIAKKPELLSTIMENCPNTIYLPNPRATNPQTKEIYQAFGCNDTQIGLISSMTPKWDYYYASEKGKRIFNLALQPIEMPFVTATSKDDQIAMNKILSKYGRENFIEQWLKYKNAEDEWIDFKENYLPKEIEKTIA